MTISKQTKTILGIFVLTAFFVGTANITFAKGEVRPTTTTAKPPMDSANKPSERMATSTKAQFASTTKAMIEQRKSDAELRISNRIEERAQFQSKELSKLMESLNSILTRTESRIAKIQAAGNVDVSEALALIATAKTAVEKAKTDVTAYQSKVEGITGTVTKETQKSLQALHKTTVESIKKAHKAVVDVINSIKLGANKTATSTPKKD